MNTMKPRYEDEVELMNEFCFRKDCRKCLAHPQAQEPDGFGCQELEEFMDENLSKIRFNKEGE